MRKFRIRTPIFAMLFAFSFTGYVQRTRIAAASVMLPGLLPARPLLGTVIALPLAA